MWNHSREQMQWLEDRRENQKRETAVSQSVSQSGIGWLTAPRQRGELDSTHHAPSALWFSTGYIG